MIISGQKGRIFFLFFFCERPIALKQLTSIQFELTQQQQQL